MYVYLSHIHSNVNLCAYVLCVYLPMISKRAYFAHSSFFVNNILMYSDICYVYVCIRVRVFIYTCVYIFMSMSLLCLYYSYVCLLVRVLSVHICVRVSVYNMQVLVTVYVTCEQL